MEISQLHQKFQEIMTKYNFTSSHKAEKLTQYIMSKKVHTPTELSKEFNLEIEEASIILEFLKKGIEFKKSTQNI